MNAILAGGGGHGFDFETHGYYLIDFAVYAFLLWFFLRKPLAAFVAARRERVMADMEEARRLREEAEAKLTDYEARLENLETEIQGILDEARQAGEAQRDRIIKDATKAAARIREDAKTRLEQEGRKLQLELRLKMVDTALTVAQDSVQKQITDSHRRKFVSEYISDVESHQGGL